MELSVYTLFHPELFYPMSVEGSKHFHVREVLFPKIVLRLQWYSVIVLCRNRWTRLDTWQLHVLGIVIWKVLRCIDIASLVKFPEKNKSVIITAKPLKKLGGTEKFSEDPAHLFHISAPPFLPISEASQPKVADSDIVVKSKHIQYHVTIDKNTLITYKRPEPYPHPSPLEGRSDY